MPGSCTATFANPSVVVQPLPTLVCSLLKLSKGKVKVIQKPKTRT